MEQDAYPLFRIYESLDVLVSRKHFSTLDLRNGYWQVPMRAEGKKKTAFIMRGGLWQWKVLLFGLTSTAAIFQKLLENVLQDLNWHTLLLYLEDIVIMAFTFEMHVTRLVVLQRLGTAQPKLKHSKCALLKNSKVPGHIPSGGAATDRAKIENLDDWPQPQSMKGIRTFLGMVACYCHYISDFVIVAKPLTRLTKKLNDGSGLEMSKHHLMTFADT